jgi:hypothetical protein
MTLSDYLSLITSWHADKPRFVNTMAVLLQPMVEAQAMLQQLTADFDIDTAIGVQLDMVGQWVGRSRYIKQPITGVYFSFDLPADRVGFDQGHWKGQFDSAEGVVALDDETYRTVLKLQAIANGWDGTLASIADAFDAVFPGVVIDDKGDTVDGLMSMDVLVPGVHLSSLLLAVLEQDFMLKPSGVRTTFLETTVPTEPLFAFDVAATPGGPMAGFDEGAWGIVLLTT